MATEPTAVTADDVDALNSSAMERSARIGRMAGAFLIVAGVLGLVAWAWVLIRSQQRIDETIGSSDGLTRPTIDFVDRVDIAVQTAVIGVISALAVGAGFFVRTLSDYLVARTGGSLTGFEEGDAVPQLGTDVAAEAGEPGETGEPRVPEFDLPSDGG